MRMSQAQGNVFSIDADNHDSMHRLLDEFIAKGDAFMSQGPIITTSLQSSQALHLLSTTNLKAFRMKASPRAIKSSSKRCVLSLLSAFTSKTLPCA